MKKILKKIWHFIIAMSLLRTVRDLLDSICALKHIDVDHHEIETCNGISFTWTPYEVIESFVALIFHKIS